ncbi:MAG: P-II family nitrogen regulator [Candidatus Omnitrophota bacterium]|jgi:nitrogen regulatory protein P-II 1
MKKIECIIRSEKLKDISESLRKIGIGGMTISDVRGFGTQNDRGGDLLFLHKTRIDIYATERQVKKIISVILMHCSAGKVGDGKIAILPLEDCIRVRTGERGEKAIA